MRKLAVMLLLGFAMMSLNAFAACPVKCPSGCAIHMESGCGCGCPEKPACPTCPPMERTGYACPVCPTGSACPVCPSPCDCPTDPNSYKCDIITNLEKNGEFGTFVTLLKKTGLDGMLKEDCSCPRGKYTVFAPTDNAFEAIPKDVLRCLVKDKKKLTMVLKHHIVKGEFCDADLAELNKLKALDGKCLELGKDDCGVATVECAKIICTPIKSRTGTIFKIDKVLFTYK